MGSEERLTIQKIIFRFLIRYSLIVILLLGAFFRFYKLDWGEGLFAHPDEYHIVISVNQLSFPTQMNPHFFSYGTVVIYLIYFTQLALNFLSSLLNTKYQILNTFLIGRFYSAFFSTLTIFIVYKIAELLWNKKVGLLAGLLVALTPGLIQQAHFLTPESDLIFFLLACLYFSLKYLKTLDSRLLILSSIFMGLALGVKVSSLPFLLIPVMVILLQKRLKSLFILSLFTLLVLFITSPFIFLDFPHFFSNIQYEGSLAAGDFVVFYTRQFISTTPFLFQLTKIYPYALGPALLVAGIVGFTKLLMSIFKKLDKAHILLLAAFLIIFIPNSLLFAKWTRFISLTFPFFAIFAAYLCEKFSPIFKVGVVLLTLFWCLAFFSIYLSPDVRITASDWIISNLPLGSKILVEGGNTIDVPLSGNFVRTSLDFYNLDTDPIEYQQVQNALKTSDYFIVESRRVFYNHQRLQQMFPKTAKLYDGLFTGKLGYKEIKEFDSFPTFFGFRINDEGAEETWSVFDHPVIRIFKRTND